MPVNQNPLGRQRRWRAWTGRLWIVAAILGIAAVGSVIGLVHDSGLRRSGTALVAAAVARQAAGEVHDRAEFDRFIGSSQSLAWLDTSSVRVTRPDGSVLFGMLDSSHDVHGAVRRETDGLTFEVALKERQVRYPLLMPISHTVGFHTMLLFLATAIVTTLAVASARKEAALAGARGDFIAGVSHDLRMPLAQILLAGETLGLRNDLGAAERASLATSVVRESRRLIGLVENILLFSRSGARELVPRRDVVMVAELFAEVMEATRLAADDGGQKLRADVDPSLAVVGDSRLLRQAVENLVDNALKYGPRGQQITLGAERAGAMVRIIVDDQGPGIPLEQRDRVFDAYERLARDESSERTGSGLGLAVVAYIARASGGRAWITDAPQRGTRAVIEVPS